MRNQFFPVGILFLLLASLGSACPEFARLVPNPKPAVEFKAQWLAAQPNLRGTVCEIGAAQKTAEQLLRANPAAPILALSPYDMHASDRRYGRAGQDYNPRDYISLRRLLRQLDVEWDSLRPQPHERAFVLADTAATNRKNGEAWLGFRGRIGNWGENIEIRLHIRLLEDSGSQQKETLGKLAINLAYAAYHHRGNSEVFLKSLLEEIPAGAIVIDVAEAEGFDSAGLAGLATGDALLASGITPYVLLTPEGKLENPLSLREKNIVPQIRLEKVPGEWTLKVTAATQVRAKELWDSAVAVPAPRPPRPKDVELTEPITDKILWKARRIHLADELKGTVVEVGKGQRISGRLFEAPYGHTLYQTLYFPNPRLAELRYGAPAGAAASWDRAIGLMEAEIAHVSYHRPHRKFVLASVFEGNRGWIGLVGETEAGKPPKRFLIEVDLTDKDERTQHEVVGALGINMLFAFYHLEHHESMMRTLSDGISASQYILRSVELP